ncbi:hypothetical protein [Occallatibacter riparius]|uniref:DUF4868 domain-containing protein n=1 Tax=Occallatibacter riparius TaxID=1002689 RepID=A0A9J7BPC4_9BACT|nr:hypothetical protein [Occallatibacter riparius]UWZ82774.1 hypothetical protein MOP44_19645 [Occallatibacter riparius]
MLRNSFKSAAAIAALVVASGLSANAAQLSGDARAAIPRDVQQLVVIDYRQMQNSPTAMQLRDRVMPPDLRQFDEALRRSGLNENHDVDQLAFALFRPNQAQEDVTTVGIAQGQFPIDDIMAKFKKGAVKPKLIRTNKVYPMGKTGFVLCFVDQSTMVFGQSDAVKASLDARDGQVQSLLNNSSLMDAMKTVDSEDLWSVLDAKGTQNMMKQVLGEAGSMADYESVRKRLQTSYYSMNFQHGVKFDLTIQTGDAFAAATVSSLLNAAVVYRRMTGDETEKTAMSGTDVTSSSGKLAIHFAASDNDFASLLKSQLFQSMVR